MVLSLFVLVLGRRVVVVVVLSITFVNVKQVDLGLHQYIFRWRLIDCSDI